VNAEASAAIEADVIRGASGHKIDRVAGDLASLRRQGLLEPGRFFTLTWSRGEVRTGAIGIFAQIDGVRLIASPIQTAARRTSMSSSRLPTRRPGSAAGGNG
jgi:hypothetical protein